MEIKTDNPTTRRNLIEKLSDDDYDDEYYDSEDSELDDEENN